MREAAEALHGMGAQVVAWNPPAVGEAMRLFFSVFTADDSAALRHALRNDEPMPQLKGILRSTQMPGFMKKLFKKRLRSVGEERFLRVFETVGVRSAEGFWKLVVERNQYRLRFMQELEAGGFDAILCPRHLYRLSCTAAPLACWTLTVMRASSMCWACRQAW
ncbi:MAG: hypothetical protein IPJ94_29660 [Chloroflexi bacterium]|nr:hypothetical protein [Chloroflexota bacterium]